MKKPIELAIIAALKAAGPQHAIADEHRRKIIGVKAAREALGSVSRIQQSEIEAVLHEACCVANRREAGHDSYTRRELHKRRRGVSHMYRAPEHGTPVPYGLLQRVARAQRLLTDAGLNLFGGGLTATMARTGKTLRALLDEARGILAAKAAALSEREAKRTAAIARVRGILSTLSPVVIGSWLQCGYRAPSERWCDRAGESVMVGLVDGAVSDLLVGTHPENAQLVRVNIGAYSATDKVWDSKGKLRSGTSSSHRLYVRETWVRDVAHRTLAVVDSMLTLDAQRTSLSASEAKRASALDNAAVYSAIWVEQGMGMHLKARGGFLAAAQTGNGLVAVHGQTVAGALRTLEQRIRPDVVAARRQSNEERTRARTAAQEAQEASFRAFATELCSCPDGAVLSALLALGGVLAAGALDAEVTVADSHAAGNCASGTRDWMDRHAPGIRAASVRTVLKLALRSGDRVGLALAACRVAVLRWSREQKFDRKAA